MSETGEYKEAVSKLAGEHKVHPYFRPETLCRGESCIRPHLALLFFLAVFLTVYGFAGQRVLLKELSNPDSISVDQNQVYITEGTSIYIYDLANFQLKAKFGERGEGPTEFMINPQSGTSPLYLNIQSEDIIVTSFNKLSFFSKLGKFKKEIKIGAFSDRIMPLEKGFVVQTLSTEEGERIWRVSIYDASMNKVKEVLKMKHQFQGPGKGYKVLQASKRYATYDNKLFCAWHQDFNIRVFDSQGNKLYSIIQDYEKKRVTEEDKEAILKYLKTEPKLKNLYELIRPIQYPEYYPALRDFVVDDGKIYVITFKGDESKSECFILDLKGKILRKLYLDVKKIDIFDAYHYTISNGKFYQMVEAEDNSWELFVKEIEY